MCHLHSLCVVLKAEGVMGPAGEGQCNRREGVAIVCSHPLCRPLGGMGGQKKHKLPKKVSNLKLARGLAILLAIITPCYPVLMLGCSPDPDPKC